MRERELQAHVELLLRTTGWRYYHTYDSRRSVAGFPDLIALRGRRILVLELKREGQKATDEQLEWLKAFDLAGAAAYVVRPENLDELAAIVAR
jgi:Holliday junction resolvase